MAAAAASRAAAACARIKPEIYRTTDDKVIVEDEFLNFLVIKMRTLSQDDIVLLAANNFSSEWIEASKKRKIDSPLFTISLLLEERDHKVRIV